MKATRQGIFTGLRVSSVSAGLLLVAAAALGLGGNAVLRAQTAEWQLVASNGVPQTATFYSMQRSNCPPFPFDPYPQLDVYSLSDAPGRYWYDDRAVDYAALEQQRQTDRAVRQLESRYGLARADAEAVMALGGWVADGLDEGPGPLPAYSYQPGDLYLQVGGVNSNASVTLYSTRSDRLYSLLSARELTNPVWQTEQVFSGAAGQDWTDLSVPVADRTNRLFFRALLWSTNDQPGDGISVALTNPADGAYFDLWPTNLTLQATASVTNGSILGVAFYSGTNLLGLVSGSNCNFTWSNVVRGRYTLSARAFDSRGAAVTSPAVGVSVDPCYPAVEVMLVVDRSGSMGDDNKFDNARQACSNFIGKLSFPADQAGLVSFSDDPSIDQTLTNSSEALLAALGQIPLPTTGDTYMSNALRAAKAELTSTRHNTNASPVIVFLSDGQPTDSTNDVFAAAQYAKTNQTRTRIFTIGIGDVNAGLMQQIASASSDYFYTNDYSDMSPLFAAIGDELCRSNAAPSVSIMCPTNWATFTFGSNLTLQATVSAPGGSMVSVQFFNNGSPIGMAARAGGLYQLIWSEAPLGTNTLTAVATDNNGLAATSQPVTITVTHSVPSVQITSPTNGQLFIISPTNILVTANASATGAVITNVQFYCGSTNLGPSAASPWQVLWTNVLAGSNYTLSAVASDSLGAKATNSVAITVNAMPVVWITYPTNSTPTNLPSFTEPTNVSIQGQALDPDGWVGSVQIFCPTGLVGVATITNGTNFVFVWSNCPAGTHPIYAVATDDRTARSASGLVVFRVDATNPPPEVAITWPTNGAVFAAGADIPIRATATNAPLGGAVTNVEFYAGANLLGSDAASPYTVTEYNCRPGTYVLVAKASDALGRSKVSQPVTFTVSEPVPRSADGFWDPVFGNPGIWTEEGDVRLIQGIALAVGEDRTLYLAGEFMWHVNGILASYTARWDGSDWYQMGDGEGTTNCVVGAGNVVQPLGGQEVLVARADASPYSGVDKWDGTNWSAFGEELDGPVHTIALLSTNVYIGGSFTQSVSTGAPVEYVARLEGTNWVTVGDGLNGQVRALAVIGNVLYAGGDFTNAGASSDVSYVAKLEGDHWVALGGGVNGWVRALVASGDSLFVGGEFTSAGSHTNANHLAKWDGKEWATVGNGVSGPPPSEEGEYTSITVRAIALRGNELFAAGRFDSADPDGLGLEAHNIAKATWSEAEQQWVWAEMDHGLYDIYQGTVYYYSSYIESLAIREGDQPGAYDLFAGGPFSNAGSGGLTSLGIARWSVGRPDPTNAPQVHITAPSMYQTFTGADPITISATVVPASAAISTVAFYVDSELIGQITDSPYEQVWYSPTPGCHKLLAVATDQSGFNGQSTPIVITVKSNGAGIQANPDFFTLCMNGPAASLPLLTNDTSATGPMHISEAYRISGPWASHACGSIQISHDATCVIYTPLPNCYGTDIFTYAVTNANGDRDTSSVQVRICARPVVGISSPADGAISNTGAFLTVSGTAFDYDGYITNVALFVNGNLYAQTTNGGFSFVWSTNVADFYTFTALVTDNDGLTNWSAPVTIALTNATTSGSGHLPVAAITSPGPSLTSLGSLLLTNALPVRDGSLALTGSAYDPDGGAVSYQIVLLDPKYPDAAPLYNVTPGPLNSQGFHPGAVTNASLGSVDLSLVENGAYLLTLLVRGGGGEAAASLLVGVESNLKIGQFSFSEQDLVIPANGIPLTVVRTYNSLNPRSADFGYSWSYSLMGMDVQLDDEREDVTIGSDQAPFADDEEDDNGLPRVVSLRTGGGWDVTLTLPDGQRATFQFYFGPRCPCSSGDDSMSCYRALWQAPAGVNYSLTALGNPVYNGISGCWNNVDNTGFETFDFTGFTLLGPDGTQYNITRGAGENLIYQASPGHYINVQAYGPPSLTSIVQRSGDSITIGSGGIFHYAAGPNGATSTNLTRSVLFERDAQGRITALYDPNALANNPASQQATNPAVRYVYHADTGNLLQVLKLVDRAAGTYVTTKYHYDKPQFPHYITSIENPLGIPVARNEYDDSGRLTAVVDADGNRTEFHHNTTNDIEVVIDRLGHTNSYAYDPRGNVTATTNALGGITLMAYDDNNNKTNEIAYLNGQPYATNRYVFSTTSLLLASYNPLGYSNVFRYNEFGQVTNSIDGRGASSTNYYDGSGNLAGTSDALGNTTTNVFDSRGLLVASGDALGTWTTNAYDDSGNLTGSAVLQGGSLAVLSTNSFGYDSNGNRTSEVVWRRVNGQWQGATNSYLLDGQNRVVQTIDPLGFTNTVVFNEIGKQAQTIDKLGHLTGYEYDFQGRLFQTTYPDLNTETSGYDSNGNRTNSVDRAGRSTTYVFDALNRLTQTIYPDNTSAGTIYDGLGRAQLSVDARGTTNAFGYDAAGQRVAVTNAWGTSVQMTNGYGFDANGNQVWATDPLGHSTTNVFDALNRRTQVLFADHTSQTTLYDAAGRRIAEVDQAGITNRFGYDDLGRLTSVTNALAKVTRYEYDEAGNQTAQIDALGRTNRFEYDGLGRRTGRTLPGGQHEGFAYDPAGNVSFHTNFNQAVIANVYDDLNRLQARVYPDGTSNTFTYTATGQRETMNDASGGYVYVYDLRDRLATNGTPAGTLYYGYDANGNVTNIQSSTASGTSVSYQYDALNRLTNVTDARLVGSQNTAYAFDAAGNLRGFAYPNGVTNLYQYDALNRMTNLTWKLTTTTLADFSYKLGLVGNRTNLAETISNTNRSYASSYDSLYRLTNEVVTGAAPTGGLAYAYDDVGNRTNRSGSLGPLDGQSFAYTDNDWLTADKYDSNGNTVTNASNAPYFYDYEDRLTNFNSGQVILFYNADGQRVAKTANGVTTLYLVDTHNPSGYAQVLEELTVSGPNTNLARAYTYGLTLISQREGSTVRFFGYDGHGSTRFLTDAAAVVGDRYTFDAYGTLVASNGVPVTAYLYCGEQLDPDLGMCYLRARYYKPDTGRFWTMDTEECDQEDPRTLHKYLYCASNPVNYKDPSGHDLEELQVINVDTTLAGFALPMMSVGAVLGVGGPDVTQILKRTLDAVQTSYNTWTRKEKEAAADRLRGLNGNPWEAWDISELRRIHPPVINTLNVGKSRYSCGAGRFAGTVAVNRKCYYAWNVNYSLFGRMYKSIYDDGKKNGFWGQSASFSLFEAKLHARGSKLVGTQAAWGENVAEAVALTEYGFNGNLPHPGLLCVPTGVVTEDVFEWKWSPNHEP